jgi:hypothetical protein
MTTDDVLPRELIVDAKAAPGDASDSGGSAMAPVVVPVLAAGVVAKLVSPPVGLAVLGAGVLYLLISRKPREGRFVLRVDGGVLEVTREKALQPPTRIALGDLLTVTLDKQTNQAGGRSTERVRIAFERRDADAVFVPDTRLTPIEAQEWQARVRVFLRKHGWLPEDER